MRSAKETLRFTAQTMSSGVLILLILFTIVTMTGSALPDNRGSGELNSESTAMYVLDAGHHHLGDGVKPELMPVNAEGTVYTKTFVLNRIDGDTASITLTTRSVVPTDTAGIGLFYDQVYVNGNKAGKLNDYIVAKEQDNLMAESATISPGQNLTGCIIFQVNSYYDKSFQLIYDSTPIISESFERTVDALTISENFNYSTVFDIPQYNVGNGINVLLYLSVCFVYF